MEIIIIITREGGGIDLAEADATSPQTSAFLFLLPNRIERSLICDSTASVIKG